MAIQQFAPINYGAMLPEIDLSQSILAGAQIRAQRQRGEAELIQANAVAAKEKAAIDRQARLDAARANAVANPSRDNLRALALFDQDAVEGVKATLADMDEQKRLGTVTTLGNIYGALFQDNWDVAKTVLERSIEAQEKAGEDIEDDKPFLALIEAKDPRAKGAILQALVMAADPDNVADGLTKINADARAAELQPLAVKKAKVDIADTVNQMANRDAGTAIAAGQLDVSRGNLAVSRAAEARQARAAGGDGKPPSESERTAGFLAAQIANGVKEIAEVAKAAPGAAKPGAGEKAAGIFGPGAVNMAVGANRQRVIAAQIEILDAGLTMATGAAYTREQLDGKRQSYFPQMGDSNATVAAKQKRLVALLKSAEIKAGKAAPPELRQAIAAAEGKGGGSGGGKKLTPRQQQLASKFGVTF